MKTSKYKIYSNSQVKKGVFLYLIEVTQLLETDLKTEEKCVWRGAA